MWSFTPSEDSYSTSATLFDFNLDGTSEIVLQDQERLRIVDASTGDQYAELTFGAGTVMQYPVVVDPYGKSGDRSARIVSIGTYQQAGSGLYQGSLNVLKAEYGHWAFARPVWNQIMYNSVNVNDDVSVAGYPVNPAIFFPGQDGILNTEDDIQPFNAFLKQTEILNKNGTPLWLTPDFILVEPETTATGYEYFSNGDSLRITVTLTNIGNASGDTVYLSAYRNAVSVDSVMATGSISTAIAVGDTVPGVITVPNYSRFLPLDKIIVILNDRGDGVSAMAECDTTNNRQDDPASKAMGLFNDVRTLQAYRQLEIDVMANDVLPPGFASGAFSLLDSVRKPASQYGPRNGTLSVTGSGRSSKLVYTNTGTDHLTNNIDSFIYSSRSPTPPGNCRPNPPPFTSTSCMTETAPRPATASPT
jgi:hypothetical protein